VKPAIIIMAKAPRPGQVKTRLSPYILPEEAAALAACFAQDTVKAARKLADEVVIAFAPRDGQEELEVMLGVGLHWTAQRGADLGERMQNACEDAAALGFGPLLLLGTDSPTFPPCAVRRAFELLEEFDVVFGPAEDGGYWCVGLRQPLPGLFEGITWSTSTVFAQTLTRAQELDLSSMIVDTWYDVDTPADLAYLCSDPSLAERAPITAAFSDERHETSA
jgi:rSAM/selenodomain-associated transferase 1